MSRPRVHLYTVCWDEADMLGFFLRHYGPWVDRFIVYDDGSTDGSLDILRAHPAVEVRAFHRSEAESFVLSHTALQNEMWKESRGQADWVAVTAIDEHLHVLRCSMADYLTEQGSRGVTLLPALGFDMNHPSMPSHDGLLVERVRRGRARIVFNKLGIFRPDAVRETGFEVGRHAARPIGDLRLPVRDEVMLWHYKHLGFERCTERETVQAQRLGRGDRAHGLGQHYGWAHAQRRAFWDEMERESKELGGDGFTPDRACVGPLWWSDRRTIVRVADRPARPHVAASCPPRVSVLIKSYDHAPYVRETIESVLDQSFQDFEIVVTDDGSTDGTLEIVRGYKDPRLRVEASPTNRGISITMNATIARARGRYLAILNSDDWALPDRLAIQTAYLDRNPDIAAVFGMPRTIDEQGRPTTPFADFRAPLAFPDFSTRTWLRQFFFQGNCLCAPTAMIRRQVYDAVGTYDPRLTNLQDLDMWVRMLIAGHAFHVMAEDLTAFRIRDGNANMSAPRLDARLRHHFELTKILRRFLDLQPDGFEAIFAPEANEFSCRDDPVSRRLALLALRDARVEYKNFGLNLLHEIAVDQNDYDRLRDAAGRTDALGIATSGELAATCAVLQDRTRSLTAALDEHTRASDVRLQELRRLSDVRLQEQRRAFEADLQEQKHASDADLLDLRSRLESELQDARTCSEHARQAVDAVHRSSSWRVTAPLRLVGRLVRGRAG